MQLRGQKLHCQTAKIKSLPEIKITPIYYFTFFQIAVYNIAICILHIQQSNLCCMYWCWCLIVYTA